MMGLMLLSSWMQAIDSDAWLEEAPAPRFNTASDSLTADTQTNSSLPNMTYGSTPNLMIGDMSFTDSRMLVAFDLTIPGGGVLPSTAVISEATLDLYCTKFDFFPTGGTILYPALLLTDFNESNANHNQRNSSTPWNVSGVEGVGVDRGPWEPGTMATISSSATITLNITALVQEALRNGQLNMSLIISGVGQPVFCSSSEHTTTSTRPSLDFTYTFGAAASQGTLIIQGPEDGSILADPTVLAIMPDLNPTITWSNLSGPDLDIQFSNGPDFRAISDGDWHWTSWDDSSAFTMASGQFDTPNTNLSDGTWVYFRMRSVNSSILGAWVSGYFALPGELGDYNVQNRMEIALSNDTVGLGLGTIHDTWVLSGNQSYNGNDDLRFRVGNSNNSSEGQMQGFIRVLMESVAIHDNVTVYEATLNLRRTDRTGDPLISAWLMDPATGHVFEELTYANASNAATWNGGGKDAVTIEDLMGTVDGNQTYSTLSFDVTGSVQDYLHNGHSGDLDFLITAFGLPGEEAEFATGDEPYSYRPHLDIEYVWGDGVPTPPPVDVTPVSGGAAWDLVGWNLTSSTTPTLSWDPSAASQSGGGAADVLIQLIPDSAGMGEAIPFTADSRTDNGFDITAGEFTVPGAWNLQFGYDYFWRLQMVEDDERGPFDHKLMVVSQMNSTDLGNGENELRFSHGNATSNNPGLFLPACGDTTIEGGASSGLNLEGQDLTVSTSQVVLVGCDLTTHPLADGLAVVSATLRMKTHQYSGLNSTSFSIPVTAHENGQHAWTESGATWNTSDGSTAWNGVGASGSERVQSLDTTDAEYDSTWYEWNVTAAAQVATRAGTSLDFILTSSSTTPVTFYDRGQNGGMPELVIIYTNGSNAAPTTPTSLAPSNGDWVLTGDVTFGVDLTPTLTWNGTSTPPANGWEVQLDSDSSFSTTNLMTFASWIDTGAFSGASFTFPNNLTAGETSHWRARGISATGQVGLWSASTTFVLPNIDVTQVDSNTYMVDLGHGTVLSDGSMPLFEDTWVTGVAAHRNDTHADDGTLFVSGSGPANALLRIPVGGNTTLPHPSSARLVEAKIELHVFSTNNSAPRLSVHEVLMPWTAADATGVTYNGTTNWTAAAGSAAADRTELVDVISNIPSGGRISLDITEISQAAIARGDDFVSLMLSVDANSNQRIVLGSVEDQWAANRPTIQLTWRNGSGTVPSTSGSLATPAHGSLQWIEATHAMIGEDMPILSWTHSNGAAISDWRVFIYDEVDGIRAGYDIFDSRTDAGFDHTNLTWTAQTPLDLNAEFRWFIQPVDDDMRGPRSASRTFIVPDDMGGEVNSTDAWVTIANGNAHWNTSAYDVAEGSYIDSCASNVNYGSTVTGLMVGSSNGGPSCNQHETRSLLRFDISNVPIHHNAPWQVMDAQLKLFRASGSSTLNSEISVANVLCNWGETTVTWNSCYTNNTWQSGGASGANDADLPIDSTNVSGDGWYTWDVTPLLQQARLSGLDTLSLLLRSEDPALIVRHSFVDENEASTSGAANRDRRPALGITYRSGAQSVPADPTGLSPSSPTTMWNTAAMRPTPLDPITVSWNHPAPSNVDAWQIQTSIDPRYSSPSTWWLYDSSDSNSYNGTFDIANLTYTTPSGIDWGDQWFLWRVRAIIDGTYSNWTDGGPFRVPDEQGSDDGGGNYSVTMQRGAVFVDSGLLPTMPDTWIGSGVASGQYQNHGSSTLIAIGVDPGQSGHDAVGLIAVDLAEYPYPATMLPTAVTLRMYVAAITGNGAHSIAIHDCSSWTESSVTWNSYNPNTQCNGTATSSMTSTTTTSGVWYEWDVTGLARSAWAGNGVMSMALKTSWTGTIYLTSAEGSTSGYAPELIVEYVDNPNGATPPAQVGLVWPDHLSVVYGEDASNEYLLDVDPRPDLTWTSLSDATGYILRLSNGSGTHAYKSWESANNTAPAGFAIGAGTSTWTPDFDLAAGEIYTWSVQALNDSVPGARSVPWTFGIGNPSSTYEGNHVYSVQIREGADVPALNHMPIDDTHISQGEADTAHGSSPIEIGVGCDPGITLNRTYLCYGFYQIDMGLMPLHPDVNPHSATLSIHMNNIIEYGGANYLDLTAYALINPNFDEDGATWNQAATGINWGASGLQPGIDYATTPLDTVRISTSVFTGWLQFDISAAMASTNGTLTIVIIPTVNAGHMAIRVDNSEAADDTLRPVVHFNYTVVDAITVSGATTTDADTNVTFTANLLDADSNTLLGVVSWSSSSGSIDENGVFTPNQVGMIDIVASYGQVSQTHSITVTPGAPVQLVVVPAGYLMTADGVFNLDIVEVIDANGNMVPGETITMTISNGTLSPGPSVTTPVAGLSWEPWTAGVQYLNLTWNTQTISIMITVSVGVPDYFVISGDSQIEAGNFTTYNFTVYDQRGNLMDSATAGGLTWGAQNGAMGNATGTFMGDSVGQWTIWLDSDLGVHSEFEVTVVYGDIVDLEVSAVGPTNTIVVRSAPTLDSISMTADDLVTFTILRIDVQGNEESVNLPLSAWTWSDGVLEVGPPTTWNAETTGSQWVRAVLEGIQVDLSLSVEHGIPVEVEARTAVTTLTSGDSPTNLDAYAIDADGNQWGISADTWTITNPDADQMWLDGIGSFARFAPIRVGDWTVRMVYTFNDDVGGQTSHYDDVIFTVLAGEIRYVHTAPPAQITADEDYDLTPSATDDNLNDLPVGNLLWFEWEMDDGVTPVSCSEGLGWKNITTEMRSTGYVWDATVVGTYDICATDTIRLNMTTITVTVGQIASVWHRAWPNFDESSDYFNMSDTSVTAGDEPDVEIRVADADGNPFLAEVTWSSDSVSGFVEAEHFRAAGTGMGDFSFTGANNQTYLLTYNVGSCNGCTGVWTVNVAYGELFMLIAEANAPGAVSGSELTIEQQTMVTITVTGEDRFGNSVPVKITDILIHEDSESLNQEDQINETIYEIYMLNEGLNTIVISDGAKSDSVEITVDGTIPGFFEANSPWSWIGLSFVGFLLFGVVLVVVVLLRRGDRDDEEYDQDLFEDDEEEQMSDVSAREQGDGYESTEQHVEEEHDIESDSNYRVDEDGTEWWQDDEGAWWYRDSGMEDWLEWVD